MKFSNLWDAKQRKTKYAPKENNHTGQYLRGSEFVYVHRVTMISLFTWKNIRCDSTIFF